MFLIRALHSRPGMLILASCFCWVVYRTVARFRERVESFTIKMGRGMVIGHVSRPGLLCVVYCVGLYKRPREMSNLRSNTTDSGLRVYVLWGPYNSPREIFPWSGLVEEPCLTLPTLGRSPKARSEGGNIPLNSSLSTRL